MRCFSFVSSSLAVVSLFVAGCSVLEDTSGELGNLEFSYSAGSCLLGCSLERFALSDATATVLVTGTAANTPVSARFSGDVGTIVEQGEDCRCERGEESRTIDPPTSCEADETKSCSLSIDLATRGEGQGTLEVVGADGEVVDRATVRVRRAKSLEFAVVRAEDVDVSPDANGVYSVALGSKVELGTHALDDDGQLLMFSRGGLTHEYTDDTILRETNGVRFFSTPDTAYFTAAKEGESTVVVRAAGAEASARFRVTP